MAFDVSALTNYVKQNGNKYIVDLITGAKTAALIYAEGNVQTGIKSAETLNVLDTDAIFQAGGTCGFNASGSTSITQRQITVGKIKVHEKLCPKDLESKFTQEALLGLGSQPHSFAFEEKYLMRKNAKIQSQLETAIWQGDTDSVNVNLNKFDGFLKIINAAVGTTNANQTPYVSGTVAASTGFVAANAVAIVNGIYAALPMPVLDKDDVVIFMGVDKLRTYSAAITAANMYHYNPERGKNNEMIIPGTNQRIIGVPGLNGTNDIVATPLSNLYIGTDLWNEEEKYELFWAKEADELRFMAEFKYGVQIAFPSQVVKFHMA